METIDLFSLRTHFNRNRILLCFNGPISRSLIEEIGNALRNYLQAENALPAAAMDVFSVYIEMTQNIRHYAQSRGYGDLESAATVVVARCRGPLSGSSGQPGRKSRRRCAARPCGGIGSDGQSAAQGRLQDTVASAA